MQNLSIKKIIRSVADAETTERNRSLPKSSLSVWLFIALLLALAPACDRSRNTFYSQFLSPDSDPVNPLQVFVFTPAPADSAFARKSYDVVLTLRHTDKCNVADFPLAIQHRSGSDIISRDTVTLILADRLGRWIGKGRHGLHSVSEIIARDITLPEDYCITIKPAFEKSAVYGIRDIGISLVTPGFEKI